MCSLGISVYGPKMHYKVYSTEEIWSDVRMVAQGRTWGWSMDPGPPLPSMPKAVSMATLITPDREK
jgi:hypothetical protein